MPENTTCHSEFGALRSVFLKRPSAAMMDDDHIDRCWKELNFLERPDLAGANLEYEQFEQLLRTSPVQLHYLPMDLNVTMDSMYCRDASIATDFGMILCNMGKQARKPEPAACRAAYESAGIPILGAIQGTGTLEGGDVAWLDSNTLAVGHTYRTNAEGIRQLKAMLTPHNVDVITVPLPHFRGPADVFHLMSILSPVDRNLAVVYSPLMPIPFRELMISRKFDLVEVPDAEFDSMGCNVLAIGPRNVLMVSGNPITRARMLEAGCIVNEYSGTEISVKGGGGPTCLTRPMKRAV